MKYHEAHVYLGKEDAANLDILKRQMAKMMAEPNWKRIKTNHAICYAIRRTVLANHIPDES